MSSILLGECEDAWDHDCMLLASFDRLNDQRSSSQSHVLVGISTDTRLVDHPATNLGGTLDTPLPGSYAFSSVQDRAIVSVSNLMDVTQVC